MQGLRLNLHVCMMNLSHNLIDTCEGISHMLLLNSLDLSHNAFSSLQSLQVLACNARLHHLSFSFNRCGDAYHAQVFHILQQIQVSSKLISSIP